MLDDAELRTPLLLEPGAEADDDLPPVLVGVLNVSIEEGFTVLVVLKRLVDESVLVLVGRNTPLLYLKDVVLVEFLRHDAGIVKQQGRPVLLEVLGWKTPE